MNLLRSVLAFSIAGAALAILGGATTATAQDPRNPDLPSSTDTPPATAQRDGEADRAKLLEARREVAILEARVAVRKAEIAEIMARVRVREAREKLSAVFADARKYQLTIEDVTTASVPFPDRNEGPRIPVEQGRQIKKAIIDAVDAKNRPILDALDKNVIMAFPDKTPLEDVLKYVRTVTRSEKLPNGIPITVDPAGMPNPEMTMRTDVVFRANNVQLGTCLKLILHDAGLGWTVKDGLLVISAIEKKESK